MSSMGSNPANCVEMKDTSKLPYSYILRESYHFFNMGQPRPLLLIFQQWFTNWAVNRDISASMTSCVCLPGLSQVWILGRCHRYFLALQDGEVTIITQTIANTMLLGWSWRESFHMFLLFKGSPGQEANQGSVRMQPHRPLSHSLPPCSYIDLCGCW